MDEPGSAEKEGVAEAIAWIEAALQAGFGEGASRSEQLREALAAARPLGERPSLDAWLQSIGAELRQRGNVQNPAMLATAVAAHLLTHPHKGLEVHARIDPRTIRNLIPPS
ncbi:hypothetical protein [Allosphingosinicella deserti]|uniref:Uncharacterized protein n=1 Tax=Allosphingosinicella deserti TaxID=2116704 RepID=A0A2P7QNY3_9SPHN|nr:hypothetical protein [Sphingomonas deserti]PSJ39685.1 hypothetical protein C7I55_13925 [Sphingomonas deserti]